ncbi:MFS transporter [Alkalitalea saponilacus]|uniref:Drug resistance transporter, EmrB/QacA subfamily n=1 Tax=Alkalitalea saponilacus TaxID=889453 RepID=A0A1T5AQ27_9BACT|nr:MFS transporter [Alkalitalea saponilacus]ASB48627.1 MFS transporter [Alkalitalea saponilacus]SKB37151.1 drug resistance transporter, EmrB/QacA subfamily [Alkalitalea saponilacus]
MSWNRTQKSALAIVTTTSFLGTFLISSVNIALPAIEEVFEMNALTLSWVITGFLLSSAILLLPLGRWADLTGIKRIYKTGATIFAISTILCGFSTSGEMLILLRVLKGVGGAMVMTTGAAILVSVFSPSERGKALGITVAAVYMGLAMGPFAGGFLTQQLGWRSIFLISGILGLISVTITWLYLGKDAPVHQPRKINLKGSLIYAISLSTLVIGSSAIPTIKGWVLIAVGVVLMALFIMIEKRAEFPVINIGMFTRNRLFAFSNLAALINYSATFAIVFLLSLYLQKIKGLSPQEAGSILLAQPLVMAILSPLTGRMSDKIEPRYLATLGMGLCTIGLALFAFVGEQTSAGLIIFYLIIMGTGFALFSSPNLNTIMSSVEKHQYAIASGVSATMRVVGQMVSMTLVTLFFAIYIGQARISEVPSEQFINGMSAAFMAFAIICFIGMWFSFNRGKMRN